MAKRLTQYEINALVNEVENKINEVRSSKTPPALLEKLNKDFEADRLKVQKLSEEHDKLLSSLRTKHKKLAEKWGLHVEDYHLTYEKPQLSSYSLSSDRIDYDARRKIENQIILSGLKGEGINKLIEKLVKEFSK